MNQRLAAAARSRLLCGAGARADLRALAFLIVCLATATAVATAHAQDAYPNRAVTIVVPYPPGGSNDVFARRVARSLAEALGQAVLVDNRPGASGNIGTAMVAKAVPDGYTLAAVSSSMVTNAAVQSTLPFDAIRSFQPVAMLARGPFVAAVANDVPVRNPAELLSWLKANPGRFNYASSGLSSSNQFATEMFKALSRTFIVHVPYRGMGPAVTDLVSGQVQLLLASGPSLLPQIRAGRVRAVGITSARASPIAPDLLPLASVLPGYEFELWWGLLAPAGTPQAIIERLNTEVNRSLGASEMRQFLLAEGALPAPQSAAQFATTIARDIPRWQKLARQQSMSME